MPSDSHRLAAPRAFRSRANLSQGPLLVFIFVLCLPVSAALAYLPHVAGIAIVVGIATFIACFVSTTVGLYILVFSMLLSPEIGVGALGGSSQALTKRGVTIRVEDLLLILLGFAWLVRGAVYKVGLLRHTPLNRPIARYVTVCVFATGMGLMTGFVEGTTPFFYVLKYIEYFVLYFIVVNNVHTRDQIERFTAALLITACIVSLMAMAQIPGGGRVTAPFEGEQGEPNTLGGYLLFVGAIAAGLSLHLDKKWLRYLLRALMIIMIVPFLFTLSRGSYLGLLFVYLTLVVLHKKRRVVMILMLVALAAMVATAMPKTVMDRVSGTFTSAQYQTRYGSASLGGINVDASTSARIENWTGAIDKVMASPVWGRGVTGYGFVDAQYPRILVETGFLGLALFILLVRSLFREALKVYRHTQHSFCRGLAMGLVAGTVGLLVHGIAANTFTIVRIMEPFWLSVGMIVVAADLDAVERS